MGNDIVLCVLWGVPIYIKCHYANLFFLSLPSLPTISLHVFFNIR